MSVNYNRARFNLAQTRNEYKKLSYEWYWPLYWDEGVYWYPKKVSPQSAWKCKRQLRSYQMRMYKTWKHNRKTQWRD